MKRVQLKVSQRESTGSAEARRMRRAGIIPGIVYGVKGSVAVSVEEKALRQALGRDRGSVIIDLDIDGKGEAKQHPAIIKEYQSDPITGSLMHIDFIEVRMDKPIESMVHIELAGTPIGLRDGGILEHSLREVHVRSLPNDIPSKIEAGIDELGIGDSIRVSDLQAPQGCEILNDPETLIAAVMAPKLVVEEVPAEEEEVEGAPAAEGGAPAAEAPAEGGESS
jgi:large subunit ribosomal protein L25